MSDVAGIIGQVPAEVAGIVAAVAIMLTITYKMLRDVIRSNRSIIDEMAKVVESMSRHMRENTSKLDELIHEIRELRRDVERLTEKIDEMTRECTALSGRLNGAIRVMQGMRGGGK